jgi:hypothetical protein
MCTNETHEQDKASGAKSMRVVGMDMDPQTGELVMVWMHCSRCNSTTGAYMKTQRRAA